MELNIASLLHAHCYREVITLPFARLLARLEETTTAKFSGLSSHLLLLFRFTCNNKTREDELHNVGEESLRGYQQQLTI